MIKKLSFAALLIFNFAFSQQNYNDSIKKVIEKDFNKIQTKDFKDLVPFHTSEGTGYINSKSKAVVLKPIYSELDFSKPNLKGRFENVFFEINGKSKEVKVFDDNFQVFGMALGSRSGKTDKRDFDIKGFTVKNDRIDSYSGTYSSEPNLFKYKTEYFALVNKGGKYAVVKPDGEVLKNLNFDYVNLEKRDLGNDVIWFKYKTVGDEEGFININGEKKLVNNLIKDSRSVTEGFMNFIDTKSSITIKYYGYSIESNDELSGVLDLVKMEWLIKPQKELAIAEMNYSTEDPLNEKYDLSDRKKLKLYFLISDGDKTKEYYIDSKLNKYQPK